MATKKTGGRDRALADARPGQLFARLRPWHKKHNPMRRYTAFGSLFREEAGWYKVDAHVAAYLKDIRAIPDDAECRELAFDVCTFAEASEINERENEVAIRQGRATPLQAHQTPALKARDMTSASNIRPTMPDAPQGEGERDPGADLTTKDVRPQAQPRRERAERQRPPATSEKPQG